MVIKAPVRVGLVGAGPWAQVAHAPLLAAGPHTVLEAVWARRPDAALALADRHGAATAGSTAELFERCEAIAFAVPPDVQAPLALEAARSGCALLLDKPIAGDLGGAEALAAAVDEAGVASLVLLTWRYCEAVRAFLSGAESLDPHGGAGWFVSGALLGGAFATPWRLERGPLLDLGPHVVDLLDAALGPVVGVRAAGQIQRFVTLQLEHESGAVSTATLSGSVPVAATRSGVALYGAKGVLDIDTSAAVGPAAFATVAAELAGAVRGEQHPIDVHRGLHGQRILDQAERQLVG